VSVTRARCPRERERDPLDARGELLITSPREGTRA
jgi:hypothetical protein